VSKFLGTYGSSGPSGTDLTDAQDFTKSGYLRFLTRYDWSFRRRYTSLSFVSGIWEYELPQDFGGIRTPFIFTSQSGYPALSERSVDEIINLRSAGDNSSYPMYFAIRAGRHDPETGQRYEAIFWPTPSSALSVYYSYYYMPPMMSNDADVPMGGAEHAETILKFCLAAAEEEGDEESGVQAAAAEACLADSVRMDKLKDARQLGQYYSGSDVSAWEMARGSTRINDVSYTL